MRRVLPIALLVTAVINALFFLWVVVARITSGYWLDYMWIVLNGLSAYGCWIGGKHLLHLADADEVAPNPRA